MSILSRWKGNLPGRLKRQAHARDEYEEAQNAYEAAQRKNLHPRAKLRHRRDQALALLRKRRKQVQTARVVIARHSAARMPKPERTKISPNRSSRNGIKPRLIVLHITVSHNRPGLQDIDAILNFFSSRAAQASSHIVNDAEGHDARCVPDEDKAWTCAAFNSVSLNIEQIEFSDRYSTKDWMAGNRPQLDNTALWIAYWSKKYGIPITHSTSNGVCQHMELGQAGGGHSDCGPGYPMTHVLARAREYAKDLR